MSGRVRVKTPHLLPKGVGPIFDSLLKSPGRLHRRFPRRVYKREWGPNNLRHSLSLPHLILAHPAAADRSMDGWMEISSIASGKRSVARSVPLMVFTKCGGYLFPIHLSGSSSTPPPARLLSALLCSSSSSFLLFSAIFIF